MRDTNIKEAMDLLFRLPRVMREVVNRDVFKPFLRSIDPTLAPHHMVILKTIDEEGITTISHIGDAAMISGAQMTRSLDKLAGLGMLERVPDPHDRRCTGIVLTDKGRQALRTFDIAITRDMAETLGWLHDAELEKLLESLRYLIKTFENFR